MKLAEALMLRADAQKRVEQIKQRLTRSARVQEGEKPPENPAALIEELDRTLAQLVDLVKRINRTNAATEFSTGATLADILANRDVLALKRKALEDLIEAATVRQDRYSRSEVKYLSTFDIAETQAAIDDLAKKYRELDTEIQETNWRIDLSE
jgi:hypothetical protein